MRKIHSKKDEAKKNKRNQIILVVVLVFVLLGSTFGVVINSFGNSSSSGNDNDNVIKYGGDEFNYQNGFWTLEKFGGTFMFLNTPYDTQGIVESNTISKTIQDYSGKPVYIYSNNSDSEIEIYRNLYSVAERIQNGCPEGFDCDNKNLPVKNCEDNIIIIEESNVNEISQDNNCIYIKGNEESLIKVSDEFLFKLLGVI